MFSNCCCCFDLELGYFTFSIINLALKFCGVATLHYFATSAFATWGKYDNYGQNDLYGQNNHYLHYAAPQNHEFDASCIGLLVGFTLFEALCLFMTLQGIIKKRSIMMFPYMIVGSLELIINLILLLSALVCVPLAGIPVLFIFLINIYIMGLHLSIYQRYKMEERRTAMSTNIENVQLLGSFMPQQ